ncbi:MAG: hypothetical protein LBJ22_06380, partial [Synergistaceae bacterium]|nr:hypothetical protein [Synergistaceae bacterium]
KWVVPAKVEGTWKLADQELSLTQIYQKLEGTLRKGSDARPISDARLDGAQIRFSVGKDIYTGVVDGKEMRGAVNGKGAWSATLIGG